MARNLSQAVVATVVRELRDIRTILNGDTVTPKDVKDAWVDQQLAYVVTLLKHGDKG